MGRRQTLRMVGSGSERSDASEMDRRNEIKCGRLPDGSVGLSSLDLLFQRVNVVENGLIPPAQLRYVAVVP